MMATFIADDVTAIAQAMKDIHRASRPLQWGIWYEKEKTWCYLTPSFKVCSCKSGMKDPTIYESEESAEEARKASSSPTAVVVKEYDGAIKRYAGEET